MSADRSASVTPDGDRLASSVVSLVLRGATLLSKFALVVFMARVLAPEAVGTYGVLAAALTLTVLTVGFDFYTFSTREILAPDARPVTAIVRDQLVFHGLVYAVVSPVLLAIFLIGLVPFEYLGWFCALLVVEHAAQEAYRLLITLSKPRVANTVLFLRSGAWVVVLLGLHFGAGLEVTLRTILGAWATGAIASVGFAARYLNELDWSKATKAPIDWAWMRRGAASAAALFTSTLALKGLQYADRFFLMHFHGPRLVGPYTVYSSFATVIETLLYTGVVAVLLPGIVSSYKTGDRQEYGRLMEQMAWGVGAGVCLLVPALGFGIHLVLPIMGNPIYGEFLTAYWLLLAAMSALVVAYLPHFALYVRHRDRAIAASSAAGLVAGVVLNLLLVPEFATAGAALGTLGATLVMLGTKSLLTLTHRP